MDWNFFLGASMVVLVIIFRDLLGLCCIFKQALRCLSLPIDFPDTNYSGRLQDKNLETHNYFMLFGGGIRLCSGKEMGLAEISIFLHYFVTKYRWEEVRGDKLVTFPRVESIKWIYT